MQVRVARGQQDTTKRQRQNRRRVARNSGMPNGCCRVTRLVPVPTRSLYWTCHRGVSWPAPLEDALTLNALLAEPVVNQRYPAKFAVPPAFRPDHFDSSEVVFVKNVLSVVNKAMSLQCRHNRGLTLTATRGPRKMNFSEWQPLTVQRVNQVFRRGFGALDL
jgi:hypothetical protein